MGCSLASRLKKTPMKHTYSIKGMTCMGCRSHVEGALAAVTGITRAEVDLEKGEAVLEMETHVPLETLQEAVKGAGGRYSLHRHGDTPEHPEPEPEPEGRGTGVFYCPMQCEGDKTYDAPGDCPVCGMDLVEEKTLDWGGPQPEAESAVPSSAVASRKG